MKTQSDMPSLLNLVISMILVIGLIYLTGWVYQKLNRVNQAKLKDKFAGKIPLKSFPLCLWAHKRTFTPWNLTIKSSLWVQRKIILRF